MFSHQAHPFVLRIILYYCEYITIENDYQNKAIISANIQQNQAKRFMLLFTATIAKSILRCRKLQSTVELAD